MPTDDADLETIYSEAEETDIATKNNVRVEQTATSQYMIHQFKEFVGANKSCQVELEVQATLTPAYSTVYFQIYNHDTSTWETIDSDNSSPADTDFTLIAEIKHLTDYKDAGNVVSYRVYQLSTP